MAEKRYSDNTHIETLANGNSIVIHPGSITRFLKSAQIGGNTASLELRGHPLQINVFTDVDIYGRDTSTQQHGAIDLTAVMHMKNIARFAYVTHQLQEYLDSPESFTQATSFATFASIGENVITAETPLGQNFMIVHDVNELSFLMFNSGAAKISDNHYHAKTLANSFDAVDARTQVIEFCSTVAEFIDTVEHVTGVRPVNDEDYQTNTYEYQLRGFNKQAKITIDLTGAAIGIGRLAITAGNMAMSMPMQETIANPEAVHFSDIAGYETVKQQLGDTIRLFQNPNLAERYGLEPTRGILLYGPAGTGKTTLAEACATSMNATAQVITSDKIYEMWVGKSGQNLSALFDAAECATDPTVLIFDELDTIVNGSGNPGVDKSVVGILKQRLTSLKNPGVLVIATTNHRDDIDSTVLRSGRFDEKIKVPLPSLEDRTAIFAQYIGDDNSRLFRKTNASLLAAIDKDTEPGAYIYGDDIEPSVLANMTEDYSCADIKEVLRQTKRKKLMHELSTGKPSNVTQADIEHSITSFNKER